ncbi:MAG: YbjN domain-containing protein [Saprospiraceae bacterium]
METLYKIVEDAIRQIGISPEVCEDKEQKGRWVLQKNDIKVWIDMMHIKQEKRAYFQVTAPIINIPNENREAFYEELLMINDKLYGVAFSIYNGAAWLKILREAEGLDSSEAYASIVRVGSYGEKYLKELQVKYFDNDGIIPGASSDG